MSYQPNIPQASDRLNDSQGDILGNFQAIQTLVDVNHYDFASGLMGKHKWVSFPIQASGPGTTSTEMALYTKNGLGGTPEMFVQFPSSGTEVNFTESAQATNGWTRLPSGILLKWGTASATQNTDNTITFPVSATIPVFTAVYSVTVNQTYMGAGGGGNNNALSAGNFTATNFTSFPRAIGTPNGNVISICYFAIGM